LYYSIFGPFIIITKIYYITKTIFFGTLLIGLIFFINKCYMVWDIIIQQSNLMAEMIPNMPSVFYKINNSIYLSDHKNFKLKE